MTERLPVLLVHGAWHGAWCWQLITPRLEAEGHTVLAPDLPGHGNDPLPQRQVTFSRYLERLTGCLDSNPRPWIVVGHSMAGMLISQLAEIAPTRVHTLVYLNAYLPCDGDSVFSLMQDLQPDSAVANAMHASPDRRSFDLDPAKLVPLFYRQTPPDLQQVARREVESQASLPLRHAVSLTGECYGAIRKVVISSVDDAVITPTLQRSMMQRQPCSEFIQIEGDHSLFFSAPATVASLISTQ